MAFRIITPACDPDALTGVSLTVEDGPQGDEVFIDIGGGLIENQGWADGDTFAVLLGADGDAGRVRLDRDDAKPGVPLRVEHWNGFVLHGWLALGVLPDLDFTELAGPVPWAIVDGTVVELDLRRYVDTVGPSEPLAVAPAMVEPVEPVPEDGSESDPVTAVVDGGGAAAADDASLPEDDDTDEPTGDEVATVVETAGDAFGPDLTPPASLSPAELLVFEVLVADLGIWMTSLEIGDRIGEVTGIAATGGAVLQRARGIRDKLPAHLALETSKGSGIRLVTADTDKGRIAA